MAIPIHSFLNFKVGRSSGNNTVGSATFQSANGQVYGISVDQESKLQKLYQLATDGGLMYDPYSIFENQLSQRSYEEKENNNTIHFMSVMLRRKHIKATRKVASFGLAFGSKHKIVEKFKQIMIKYLNHIFDTTQVDTKNAKSTE